MRPDDGRVVSNFIVQALAGHPITLYGGGTQTRAFCYVDDLIDGLVRLMDTPDDFSGPVNLGNPHEFTIRDLARRIVALTHSTSRLEEAPLPENDPCRRRPDIAVAKQVLGWEPRVELAEGLKRTLGWFGAGEANVAAE
jgi:UDP-glucuronate decarboxylase